MACARCNAPNADLFTPAGDQVCRVCFSAEQNAQADARARASLDRDAPLGLKAADPAAPPPSPGRGAPWAGSPRARPRAELVAERGVLDRAPRWPPGPLARPPAHVRRLAHLRVVEPALVADRGPGPARSQGHQDDPAVRPPRAGRAHGSRPSDRGPGQHARALPRIVEVREMIGRATLDSNPWPSAPEAGAQVRKPNHFACLHRHRGSQSHHVIHEDSCCSMVIRPETSGRRRAPRPPPRPPRVGSR
jgi:hypothetical protein